MKKLLLAFAAGVCLSACATHDPKISIVPYPNHLEPGHGTFAVKGEGGVKGLPEGLGMSVAHAAGNKCLRCWKFATAVGDDGLCPRCAKVLG